MRHTFFCFVLALLHDGALQDQALLQIKHDGAPPALGRPESDVEVLDSAPSSPQSQRIVGGKDANYKKHPYQLQLAIDGYHQCGAALISKWWAVTAAHCMLKSEKNKKLSEDAITLRAGATYRDTGGRVHSVSKVIIHPRYDTGDQDYDVTLLKVRNPFLLGSQVHKIALPSQNQKVMEGEMAVVSGWGYQEDEGEMSDSLQYVMIPIVSQKKCASHYKKHEIRITERMLCAGLPRGRKDACQGDSGGPMAINDKLIGIVSWGVGCALPKSPGVYTSIPKVRYWIKEHTGV